MLVPTVVHSIIKHVAHKGRGETSAFIQVQVFMGELCSRYIHIKLSVLPLDDDNY